MGFYFFETISENFIIFGMSRINTYERVKQYKYANTCKEIYIIIETKDVLLYEKKCKEFWKRKDYIQFLGAESFKILDRNKFDIDLIKFMKHFTNLNSFKHTNEISTQTNTIKTKNNYSQTNIKNIKMFQHKQLKKILLN